MASPARFRPPSSIRPGALARGDVALLLVVALLTAVAWFATVRQTQTMPMAMPAAPAPAAAPTAVSGMSGMSGMTDQGGAAIAALVPMAVPPSTGWAAACAFFVAWIVMMAAMMLPAATPTIALYRRIATGQGGSAMATATFAATYLLAWGAVGIPVWAAIQYIPPRLPAGWATWAPAALGATLVLAGLYQLSPLKRICLRHCQSPLGFLLTHWRGGLPGAVRMGLRHAGFCLGCCWALFAILVAAGVMSLPWMLLLTLLIVVEKTAPGGGRVATLTGVALAALGALVAIGAVPMPWRM
ncbi:MAG TPA: DUF2182 domain-containing protein [Thermomicrobiales bacterium]|nr:DUF2182 domain-containing protein [Thermomicrobiales bacterium]